MEVSIAVIAGVVGMKSKGIVPRRDVRTFWGKEYVMGSELYLQTTNPEPDNSSISVQRVTDMHVQ